MNFDEIKEPDGILEKDKEKSEPKEFNQNEMPQKCKITAKKIMMLSAAAVIIIAGLSAAKNILLKPQNNNLFTQKTGPAKPLTNKSPDFSDITGKPALQAGHGAAGKTSNPDPLNDDNSTANNYGAAASFEKKGKTAGWNEPSVIPAPPALPQGNIKDMLKFNAEINKLSEEAKIARLKRQIKNLRRVPPGSLDGISGNANEPNMHLVAVTKNTAIIAFGKRNVLMRTGMKYAGYECLMINKNGVALEKNNIVINLSLSM